MEPIKACSTYHAVAAGRQMLRPVGGKSAFKVYFADIIGRDDPARTVWDQCGVEQREFLAKLTQIEDLEGTGFVTAFPHITKVFRFGPEAETVLNVRAFESRSLESIDLARSGDYVEFACLAEALIAADEYRFWAAAESVEEYLARWSDFADGPIVRHDKLKDYWRAATGEGRG